MPKVPNVIFMAGRKFGSTGYEDLTWAMNAYVPALVAEAFVDSRIVAFSTGNVYPWVNVAQGGATEAMLALENEDDSAVTSGITIAGTSTGAVTTTPDGAITIG